MSLSNSLTGISFSGIGSGIDTDSIVRRLIQVESIPIQRLQQQQQQIAGRMSGYADLRSRLSALNQVASSLSQASSFQSIQASSSASGVATITAGAGALPGTYNLEVSKLATTHKIGSAGQANATSALGLVGNFSVNGVGVEVVASDTLTTIAQKINSAGAGVTASILNGGEGNAFLTLTASRSGAGGAIQLSDLGSGSVLSDLGLVSGAAEIRSPIANGALSQGFVSPTQIVSEMLKVQVVPPDTVQIVVNGQAIDVNLTEDSLETIASKINAAGAEATATVESFQSGNQTMYRLQIVGDNGMPTFVDNQNVLSALGIVQRAYGNQLVAAQDAEYSLDGIALTSATNTINGVIPGATLRLLKANETTPEKSTLTLSRDDSAILSRVKDFVAAYNGVVEFINANSKFDAETLRGGAFLGDSLARQVESVFSGLMFSPVAGLSGSYTNLASLGFSVGQNARLELDESRFNQALAADPSAVAKIFRTTGTGSNSDIVYVSSSDKTKSTGNGTYDVVITQPATRATYSAATAQSGPSALTETLTFGGSLFGGSSYVFLIESGSTLQQTVDKINGDSKLKSLISASIVDGRLHLESKRFGASGNFTVESSLAGDDTNSGIGQGMPGAYVGGLDVAGTINGEPATGAGQFLTGNVGNANTAGLQIQYTGSATGLVGSISVIKGIGSQVTDQMQTFLDSVNGLVTTSERSLQAQIDSIDESILRIRNRLESREMELKFRFSKMDETIAALQNQGQRLSMFMQQMAANNRRD